MSDHTYHPYHFVDFEFPATENNRFFIALDDAGVLRSRREQLGLTMQQVADMAGVQFSQYQKLESGERNLSGLSMKAGLAICAVLLLDPYKMVNVNVHQKEDLKPQRHIDIPQADLPKHAGRKQIRRNVMTVYVNHGSYSIMIPMETLESIGSPDFIKLLWHYEKRRIVLQPMDHMAEGTYDVPKLKGSTCLVFPQYLGNTPIDAMNWGGTMQKIEAEIVKDKDENILLLIDLTKAKPFNGKVVGPYVIPTCIDDGEENDGIPIGLESAASTALPRVVYFDEDTDETR